MGSILYPFLLLHVAGAFINVQIEPKELTVLQGMNATFNCSLDQSWVVMSWMLNDLVVLTISRDHGVLTNNPHFVAQNYSHNQNFKWEFTILDVNLSQSGRVSCDVQNIQKQTANLYVQESGTVTIQDGNRTATKGNIVNFQCQALGWYPEPNISWLVNGINANNDTYSNGTMQTGQGLFNATRILNITATNSCMVECLASVPALATPITDTAFLKVESAVTPGINQTVAIAVTVTVVAVVLLVLIIILVVVFCKRRKSKNSSYQEEVRKTMSQKDSQPSLEKEQGRDNLGFATDSHTGVISSRLNDNGFSQSGSVSTAQMPSASGVFEASNPSKLYTHHSAMKNTRHATIV